MLIPLRTGYCFAKSYSKEALAKDGSNRRRQRFRTVRCRIEELAKIPPGTFQTFAAFFD